MSYTGNFPKPLSFLRLPNPPQKLQEQVALLSTALLEEIGIPNGLKNAGDWPLAPSLAMEFLTRSILIPVDN